MGEVMSINISSIRGINKTKVNEVKVIEGWGIEGDAHGGDWDRQISIFPIEALEKVPEHKKEEVLNGGYTENFTILGIDLDKLSSGASIKIGEAIIKILHIGKEKFKENGRPYIVSREGRFGKVVEGGIVKIGDNISIL